MSFLEILLKGGWLMLPILFLSVLALYGFIERIIVLHTIGKVSQKWTKDIYSKISIQNIQEAKLLCDLKTGVIPNVVKAGLNTLPHNPTNLEHAMETAGQAEMQRLEKNLSLLNSIAGIAPMLGFLGTVLGMIEAFRAMAHINTPITPKVLAGGIYEAMITTAAGLIVGILADASYKYIVTRIEKLTYRMGEVANKLIEVVKESYQLK